MKNILVVVGGGCGDTNGKSQIEKTAHLDRAYELGKSLYQR